MSYSVVQNDELYHTRSHKYIDRKWKNGQWEYTYYKPKDRYYSYDRYPRYSGKLAQTRSKDGTILTERVKSRNEGVDASWGRVIRAKQDFENSKYSGNRDAAGRNYAAIRQEADRQRKAAEAKNPTNVVKATVKSISTSVGSAFDKGKNWLSKVFSTTTKIDYNPKPVGKINVVKGADGSLTAVGVERNKKNRR